MKPETIPSRWCRALIRHGRRFTAALVVATISASPAAAQTPWYGQMVPQGSFCPPQGYPPSQYGTPGPYYAPPQQYAPSPVYTPQPLSPPRQFSPNQPTTPSTPGRSLPNQNQSGQQSAQPPPTTNRSNANANNPPVTPPPSDAQAQVQNAMAQNQGNNNSNIFQASLEQELGGQGGDGFGGAGYGRGAQAPPNSVGDFFGGRLRSRRSLLSVGQQYLFTDGQLPDIFEQVDTSLPAVLGAFAFQVDDAGVVQNDVIFSQTSQTVLVNGIPVTALRADNIVPDLTALLPDAGPFVLQTVGTLPGIHPDPLLPAQQFTEDVNRNGILDPGEDLNLDGVINPLAPIQTEVFGLFRELVIPNPGDNVGRLKLGENNNPIPRDRIVLDYTWYNAAAVDASGRDVQRYAPGFEKTLFGGNASVDVRLPFASTIQSAINTSSRIGTGFTNASDIEFGNVSVTGKLLLARDARSALSVGVQAVFPTASDVTITDVLGQRELLRIENEAIHLAPFIAFQHSPSERSFVQYYFQYDHEVKGNPLFIQNAPMGTIEDVDFIYADISMGYWLYRNAPITRTVRRGNQIHTAIDSSAFITGFAPRVEFHYNRSLGGVETQQFPGLQFGQTDDKLETLNLTVGGTLQMGIDKELTVAWGTPLLNQNDSDFDQEVRIMFNWLLPQ